MTNKSAVNLSCQYVMFLSVLSFSHILAPLLAAGSPCFNYLIIFHEVGLEDIFGYCICMYIFNIWKMLNIHFFTFK